jgi:hypothetical protein
MCLRLVAAAAGMAALEQVLARQRLAAAAAMALETQEYSSRLHYFLEPSPSQSAQVGQVEQQGQQTGHK